jgi:DNA gyrase subunit A
MKLNEDRGRLVGGLIVAESDEVIAIKTSGQIIRVGVADVAVKGRDTMGVKFVGLRADDQVAAIALYPEDDKGLQPVDGSDEVSEVDPGALGAPVEPGALGESSEPGEGPEDVETQAPTASTDLERGDDGPGVQVEP